MTPDELRTFALDAFTAVGGTNWMADLHLGLLTLALARRNASLSVRTGWSKSWIDVAPPPSPAGRCRC